MLFDSFLLDVLNVKSVAGWEPAATSTHYLSVSSARFPPTFYQTAELCNGCKDPMGGPAVGLAVKQFWFTKEKKRRISPT